MTLPQAPPTTADDFNRTFEQVKNWGRWGADDQRGTLNLITKQASARAAALVTEGHTVSCAHPIPVVPTATNRMPANRAVLAAGDVAGPGWGVAMDQTTIAPHGFATSHMDALCHIFWDRQMYNGFPASRMTSRGAEVCAIDVAREGIVGRGVLLDVPRALGKGFLAGGEAILPEDLDATEQRQGIRVEEGDILLVYTGRARRERGESEAPTFRGAAGLHMSTMPWLHERGVALLGCDGVSDVLPGGNEACVQPVHACAIVAMGLHLLDNLSLEPLADACAERNRWTFQLVVAPLIIKRGTGSAVNPIAIF